MQIRPFRPNWPPHAHFIKRGVNKKCSICRLPDEQRISLFKNYFLNTGKLRTVVIWFQEEYGTRLNVDAIRTCYKQHFYLKFAFIHSLNMETGKTNLCSDELWFLRLHQRLNKIQPRCELPNANKRRK